MERYLTTQVFTPTSPARINFVKRSQIIRRLKRGLETTGTQIVLYGHTGSGKTTLLLNTLENMNYSFVKTNCTESMSFEQLLANVYLELEETLKKKVGNKETTSNEVSFGIPKVLQVKFNTNSQNYTESERVSELDAIELALARLLGELSYQWVVEDFHKLKDEVKKQLVQMMKVFMDKADEYPDLKIVALGAKDTAREVIDLDIEMQRRVNEIYVPLMTDEEVEKIIINGCSLLNIEIDESTVDDVKKYSHGVGAICHQLCKLMCESDDIDETIDNGQEIELHYEHFNYAVSEYMEIVSDSLKANFQNAIKVNESFKVISCLTKKSTDGADFEEILDFINENNDAVELSSSKLQNILEKLTHIDNGSIIRLDEKNKLYSFKDPFYKMFADIYLRKLESTKRLTTSGKIALMDKALRSMKKEMNSDSSRSNLAGDVSTENYIDIDDKHLISTKYQEAATQFERNIKN